LCLLGLMSSNTRLPIVELSDACKTEIDNAIGAIGDEDIACRGEHGHGHHLPKDSAAAS
jgi:4-hydroxy-tetrahydrodipicolinate synthase